MESTTFPIGTALGKRDGMLTILSLIAVLLFGTTPVRAADPSGDASHADSAARVIMTSVPAPTLAKNKLGDTAVPPIAIYLPPSYGTAKKRYPAVYFLTGFGDNAADYTNKTYNFPLPDVMDTLIRTAKIPEMILVIVSGCNLLGGSFYVNSPVTGNWEDYVVKDVIPYVDKHYRTIADVKSRGIAGHSMGGSGAFFFGMRYPQVFSVAYCMSPGFFDSTGLSECQMFAPNGVIDRYLAMSHAVTALAPPQALAKFRAAVMTTARNADWDLLFTMAYGAAFAPNAGGPCPFIKYPISDVGGEQVIDSAAWRLWESGFGGVKGKIDKYKANLQQLKGLTIEYGTKDEYAWIPKGCRYLSEQLKAAGIKHELLSFPGGHQDQISIRLVENMLPFFAGMLATQ